MKSKKSNRKLKFLRFNSILIIALGTLMLIEKKLDFIPDADFSYFLSISLIISSLFILFAVQQAIGKVD